MAIWTLLNQVRRSAVLAFSILIVVSMSMSGCILENLGSNKGYMDCMSALTIKLKKDPKNQSAWKELTGYTSSWDLYERDFALYYIGEVYSVVGTKRKARIIQIYLTGLKDIHQSHRRAAILGILTCGTSAINVSIPQLIDVVKGDKGYEEDVAWFATKALGLAIDRAQMENIREALMVGISNHTLQSQEGAPRVRRYALESLRDLSVKGYLDKEKTVAALTALLPPADATWRSEIEKALVVIQKPKS